MGILKHKLFFLAEVRMLLGDHKIKLIAKIENKRGMDNYESILKRADAICVDRGCKANRLHLIISSLIFFNQIWVLRSTSSWSLWRRSV
jgi:hypothetical protein